jgi:hypothetical protein
MPASSGIGPLDRKTPPAHSFEVISPVVRGPVAASEVLHAFLVNGPELSACVDLDRAHAPRELGLELVVDETGDVFRVRATAPAAPPQILQCIESVASAMVFGRPAAAALVSLTLRVHRSS